MDIASVIIARKRFLDPDRARIGENIRTWIVRRQHRYPSWTHQEIARKAGIDPSSLSRILRGYGLSEPTLLRIAEALNIHPGHFLVGIDRPEKFPNVPRLGSGRKRRVGRRVGKPVRNLVTLLNNPQYLSAFVGGLYDQETAVWTRNTLWTIYERTRIQRQLAIEQSKKEEAERKHYFR
jgi:transcriptional regulator with XRE-family HTH domain